MNFDKICAKGLNKYRATQHLNEKFYLQLYRDFKGSKESFVAFCVQDILNRYDEKQPPCLEAICRPFSSISKAIGVNIRDTTQIKSFISGYKQLLVESGKKRNYSCPVFLDHGLEIMMSSLANLKDYGLTGRVLEIKFLYLMKLYFGVRTGDMCKVRYCDFKRISEMQISIGSDGRNLLF